MNNLKIFFVNLKNIINFINTHPLGKKRKFYSYIKFISWQISQYLSPKLVKKNWVNDIEFMAKKGMTGITGSIYVGMHEFEEMSFLLHYLTKENTFIDVGANVGCYSLLAASKASTVLSFEPDFDSLSILNLNLKINGFKNVKVYNHAVGEENKTVSFTKNLDTVNHIANSDDKNSREVQMISIDNLCLKNNEIVMKIDVEGYEEEVLKGGKELLKKQVEVVIVETNNSNLNYGSSNSRIFNLLKRYNFKPYTYNPFSREFIKISDKHIGNTIFLKEYEKTLIQIKNSKPIKVFSFDI